MPAEKADANGSLTNVRVLLVLLLLACDWWWWASFSGPFRWLVDLELRLFGNYWEPSVAIALGIAVLGVASLVALLPRRMLPRRSGSGGKALLATVFIGASVAGLAKGWQRWEYAAHLPSRRDPVQVVDLDRIGGTAPPTGHVRLIGVADRSREVRIRSVGRRGVGGHTDVYVPVTDRQPRDPTALVRIVATHREETSDSAQRTPDDADGVLLADGLDTRTIYELRRRGMRLVEHPLVLFSSSSDVSFDAYVEACLLALPILLFWPFAAYRWVRERSSRPVSPTVAPSLTAADAPHFVALPSEPRETPRSRLASAAAMIAFCAAAGAVWLATYSHDFRFELACYAAAGLLFVVCALLFAFGSGAAVTTPPAASQPTAASQRSEAP